MNATHTAMGLSLVTAVLAALACGPSGSPTVQVASLEAATPTQAQPAPAVGGGVCEHEYVPAEEGTTWEFTGTNSYIGTYHRTDTITEARDDGYSVSIVAPEKTDLTYNFEVTCTDEALIVFDPTQQFITASATGASGTTVATTLGHEGITLPKQLEAGDTWGQWVELEITGGNGSVRVRYDFDYGAIGIENVTVPFDTVNAMRIDVLIHSMFGERDAGPCQVSSWFTLDVGRVKQTVACNLFGVESSDSIELVSTDSP